MVHGIGGEAGVGFAVGRGFDTGCDGVAGGLLVAFVGFRVGFCCCRFTMLARFLYTWDCFLPMGSENCFPFGGAAS